MRPTRCCAALLQFADLPACDSGSNSVGSALPPPLSAAASFSSSSPLKREKTAGEKSSSSSSSSSLIVGGGGGACALSGGVAGGHALAALGDVLGALARGAPHVPFRNSALTKVLSATLRPGARAALVLAVPGAGGGGGGGGTGNGDVARAVRDAMEFGLRARAVELGPPRRLPLLGGGVGVGVGTLGGDAISGVPRVGTASQLASGLGALIGVEGGYAALLAATEVAKIEGAAEAERRAATTAKSTSSSCSSSPATARRRLVPRSPSSSPVPRRGRGGGSLVAAPASPLSQRPEWRG